jgi:hypothetical protein
MVSPYTHIMQVCQEYFPLYTDLICVGSLEGATSCRACRRSVCYAVILLYVYKNSNHGL